MDEKYTKSNPKIQDYNPLTHTLFYKETGSPSSSLSPTRLSSKINKDLSERKSTVSPNRMLSNMKDYPIETPQVSFKRPTILAAKNIVPVNPLHSKSFEGIKPDPKYFKTSQKNTVIDPISGNIRVYNIQRPKLQYLDKVYNKDKITNIINHDKINELNSFRSLGKVSSNIAGSLKKEVPNLAYVNPFLLKSYLK